MEIFAGTGKKVSVSWKLVLVCRIDTHRSGHNPEKAVTRNEMKDENDVGGNIQGGGKDKA